MYSMGKSRDGGGRGGREGGREGGSNVNTKMSILVCVGYRGQKERERRNHLNNSY